MSVCVYKIVGFNVGFSDVGVHYHDMHRENFTLENIK